METKAKFKKIASIAGNVLLWVFVLFSLLITIMVFSAQNSKDGIPSLFGKSLVAVRTDSMKNTFAAGDLIIIDKVPQEEVASLLENDVIIYRAPIDIDGDGNVGDLNTHRIIEHNTENHTFVTKGDNNPLADNEGDYAYTVSYADVVGKYTGTHLKGVGSVISFLRTSLGFFLCIVLPLILFFLYELYNFISILVTERAKKAAIAAPVSKDTEEEIKRKAIEEYLKNQEAQKAAAEAVKKTPAEEAPVEETPVDEASADEKNNS